MAFKRNRLFLALVFGAWCWADSPAVMVVPHLPRDTQNFKVSIVIDNLIDEQRHLTFEGYDENGNFVDSVNWQFPPLSREVFTPAVLFEGQDVSYFFVRGNILEPGDSLSQDTLTGLMIGVVFQLTGNPGSSSYVSAITETAKQWRIHPGDWQQVFDGLAVVNTDPCTDAPVEARHYDASGQLLATLDLAEGDGIFHKALVDLSTKLEPVPGSYVDIVGNVSLAVTALRGSLARGEVASYIVGNMAVPLPDYQAESRALERNRAIWQRTGVSQSYVYEFTNYCFCVEDLTRTVTVMVQDGRILWMRYTDSDQPVPEIFQSHYLTVEGLFELVEKAVADNVDGLQVSYDKTYGYPTEIFIDYEHCLADEERIIKTANLTAVR